MNEREARGWELVRQAIERGKPLDAELMALFSQQSLPGHLSVVKGALQCLIKIASSAQAAGLVDRILFQDQLASDIIRRTEARLMNDMEAALQAYALKNPAPMIVLVSALVSVAVALKGKIRAASAPAETPAAAPSASPAAFTEGGQAARFRGYAIQTVERDTNDEIVKTRTDYFGPGAPL